MSAHTAGPWKVGKYGTNVLDASGFSIADADWTGILEKWEDTGAEHWSRRPGGTFIERGETEAEANARLIAAAPQLLEAAKKMLGACGQLDTETLRYAHGPNAFVMEELGNAVRAAEGAD